MSSGSVAVGYERVRAVFEGHLEREWTVGAGFAAYVRGQRVVDLYGGLRAPGSPLAYDAETLQLTASNTKFVESLCIALLVDRGLLAWDDPIATYWPSFDSHGKGRITVRQLMMHRAGLAAFQGKLTDREMTDSEARAAFLEGQSPEHLETEPSDWRDLAPQAYHAVSRGIYSGELLRRVDPQQRTMGRFFHEEFAIPLDLQFFIGLPESEEDRLSPLLPSPHQVAAVLRGAADRSDPRFALFDEEIVFLRQMLTPGSLQNRAVYVLDLVDLPRREIFNHRKIRQYELPSSNGIGTAEALARLAAFVARGGAPIFGSSETLREAAACAEHYPVDEFMLTPVEFTQGGWARMASQDRRGTVTYGWCGAGGQMVRFLDELELGCAYLTNTSGVRLAMNDPRANELLAATLDCAWDAN